MEKSTGEFARSSSISSMSFLLEGGAGRGPAVGWLKWPLPLAGGTGREGSARQGLSDEVMYLWPGIISSVHQLPWLLAHDGMRAGIALCPNAQTACFIAWSPGRGTGMILHQVIPKLVLFCYTCPRTPQGITHQPNLCGCSGAWTVIVSVSLCTP